MKKFFSCSGRVLLGRVLARFHCALVAAIGCAAVLEVWNHTGLTAYLRGLLFCIPVALSYYAEEKLPALWQFLAAALLISCLSGLLLGHIGGFVLALIVFLFRFRSRLSEEKTRSLLDAPFFGVELVFLAAFCLSGFQGLPVLQRLSLISASFYLLILMAFQGLERLDDYLTLNRDMYDLPARRIRRMVGGALAGLLFLTGALLLPAAFGASGEVKLTIPESGRHGAYVPPQVNRTQDFTSPAELLGGEGTAWHIPAFVSYILYAVSVALVAALFLFGVYKLFRHFRASFHDSRDVVQFLDSGDTDEAVSAKEAKRKRPAFWDRSPNALIRRKYRKTLLRASASPPKRWQAPAELESEAGVSDPCLHALYEKARYGPAPCTAEDLRALKETGKKR